jgi:hypothetical protein
MMDQKKIEEITRGLEGVRDAMKNLDNVLSGGPASYYYERIIDYYKGCMKAAKFKVGDRVELKEDCKHWDHHKHYMIKGALATVISADYYKGNYRYEIEFDDETWINMDGVKKVPERKHCFAFGQKNLKRHKV